MSKTEKEIAEKESTMAQDFIDATQDAGEDELSLRYVTETLFDNKDAGITYSAHRVVDLVKRLASQNGIKINNDIRKECRVRRP